MDTAHGLSIYHVVSSYYQNVKQLSVTNVKEKTIPLFLFMINMTLF